MRHLVPLQAVLSPDHKLVMDSIPLLPWELLRYGMPYCQVDGNLVSKAKGI